MPTADSRPARRFAGPGVEALPADLKARVAAVSDKLGFVPEVFATLARRPDELRAFLDHHDALMGREGGLDKTEREMIVVATSARNACLYCVVAHGAILRLVSRDKTLADDIAVDFERAAIDERRKTMLRFAIAVAEGRAIDDERVDAVRAAGFDDDEIWDIGAIAAFFAMSNRLAHLTAMAPNREFYGLGR
jgi:uncharacterized peroxidase-related enzyme